MPRQWKLPGPNSPYLIVWSYDEAAKDTRRHVSPSAVCGLLDGWIRARKQVIREIYEALDGSQSLKLSSAKEDLPDVLIKKRLAEAFTSRVLVALTEQKTQTLRVQEQKSGVQPKDPARTYGPFRVYLPKDKKKRVTPESFTELACMQVFGLKSAADVKALHVHIKGFEGRPAKEEIAQGYVDVLFDASLYERKILSSFGSDPGKVKAEIAARRKRLGENSKEEQEAIRTKANQEFERRTGRKPSTSNPKEDRQLLELLQDVVLRQEDSVQPRKETPVVLPKPIAQGGTKLAPDQQKIPLGIVALDGPTPLRLRSSPTTVGNNVIRHLAFNTHVQLIEQVGGGWLHLSTRDGSRGYAAADYIWSAPKHPLPEPNARLHRVEKYSKAAGEGTAIAIAQKMYGVKWGGDLRFYVALLGVVNRIPIPSSIDGWKDVSFQAGQMIWIPSKEFADGLRGTISSGSYSYELASALGIAELVSTIGDALARVAQFLNDLALARLLADKYIPLAVAKHVEESLISALESLLLMAAVAVALLAASTALGAIIGAAAGGAGAAPGAAIGFEFGLVVLEWAGLAFLAKWLVESAARIGSAFATFLGTVWNARGDSKKIDQAARELAEAFGIMAGVVVEALVMWAAAKGVTTALKQLKGTQFEKVFGESRLGAWLRQRVANHGRGNSRVPNPREAFLRIRARLRLTRGASPASSLVSLSKQAHPRYARELKPAQEQISKLFGELGEVQARAKDPVSAANRLQRAIDNFGAKVTNVSEAIANLWDAIGTRLVLSDTSPGAMNKVVGRLVDGIRQGKLQISEINNLHGPEGKPYFSPEHIQALRKAAAQSGQVLRINESKNMESGYTVVCAYLRHANGVRGEFQIIGPEVLKIANAEHIPYDVSLGKPLVRDVPQAAQAELQKLVSPVEGAMRKMTEAQHVQYLEYLNRSYIHARSIELGIPSEAPKLPEGLNEVLSVESIQQIEKAIAAIKKKYKR